MGESRPHPPIAAWPVVRGQGACRGRHHERAVAGGTNSCDGPHYLYGEPSGDVAPFRLRAGASMSITSATSPWIVAGAGSEERRPSLMPTVISGSSHAGGGVQVHG